MVVIATAVLFLLFLVGALVYAGLSRPDAARSEAVAVTADVSEATRAGARGATAEPEVTPVIAQVTFGTEVTLISGDTTWRMLATPPAMDDNGLVTIDVVAELVASPDGASPARFFYGWRQRVSGPPDESRLLLTCGVEVNWIGSLIVAGEETAGEVCVRASFGAVSEVGDIEFALLFEEGLVGWGQVANPPPATTLDLKNPSVDAPTETAAETAASPPPDAMITTDARTTIVTGDPAQQWALTLHSPTLVGLPSATEPASTTWEVQVEVELELISAEVSLVSSAAFFEGWRPADAAAGAPALLVCDWRSVRDTTPAMRTHMEEGDIATVLLCLRFPDEFDPGRPADVAETDVPALRLELNGGAIGFDPAATFRPAPEPLIDLTQPSE